jgi:periplasmic protein TonB
MKKFFVAITVIIALFGLTLNTGCKDKKESANTTEVDSGAINMNPVDTSGTTGNITDTSTNTGRTTAIRKHTVRVAPPPPINKAAVKMETDTKGYYNYTETMPSYPGGQTALEDYVTNHLEYPANALDNNIEGTVEVKFTVDENGKVGNVQTSGTALGYGLEEAAMNAVTQMKFNPGTVNGKRVKSWYTLPVTFKIED